MIELTPVPQSRLERARGAGEAVIRETTLGWSARAAVPALACVQPSFCFTSSATILGFPCPFVCFITRPTMAPKTFRLPPL